MGEYEEIIRFDSPEGFSREFSLPLSYARVLHKRLDVDLSLWDDFEANVLPLSYLLQPAISSLLDPQNNSLQIVHMACGSKGATEAWSAHVAAVRLGTKTAPVRIRSLGIDNDFMAIDESEEKSQNLSKQPSLIKGSSQKFIVSDGGSFAWTSEILPSSPLLILMRHPDNTHYPDSFQRVTDVCVRTVEKTINAGQQALFIVTTSSNVPQEGLIAISQMENSLKQIQNSADIKILSRMIVNKFPTRKMVSQDDGHITYLGSEFFQSSFSN